MGAIEDIYEDLEAEVSLEEFREAVLEKVEQMGGLADEETAAMLIAHELGEDDVNAIDDIEAGMDEVTFLAKVVGIGELRTFERDDEEEPGRVINVEAADETGTIRLAFWDEQAQAVVDEGLEPGTVLRVRGQPRDGYDGVEVSVYQAEVDEDAEIDVGVGDAFRIGDLTLGRSGITLRGQVLAVDEVRTFERDDGTTGRVSNLAIGDETGRIRVTLWDEHTSFVETVEPGETIEVVDGYVRERDGALELHLGDRGDVRAIDEEVEYVPQTTPIADLELEDVVDIGGVIRSVDPIRTFERDDGSEGQVRNVRVQDTTGDIRVALWGDRADVELAPGDTAVFTDVEIRDGWQDDLEASAGWRSTVTITDQPVGRHEASEGGDGVDLGSFAVGGDDDEGGGAGIAGTGGPHAGDEPPAATATATESTTESATEPATSRSTGAGPDDRDRDGDGHGHGQDGGTTHEALDQGPTDGEEVEFTGTVVQTGDPAILDNGEETMSIATDEDLTLGQEVTARGVVKDGRLEASEIF